ncbi:peroxidase family protein [Kutzneria sp. 744]|uniref:peroxidase family protein n=1 Tax=Kutzneria sp. (strain 744) TaxID=345341 RepID=UPI0003EEBD94|nr:peroxidase family protein [Kutzneria sp. 744]EWM18079.1 peroxidase [Kutzneria sp. 744]
MSDDAFLHELESDVKAELDPVSQQEDEWLGDPEDGQRYEVGLRSLLGAVEAVEDVEPPRPAASPWSHQLDSQYLNHIEAMDRPVGPAHYGRMFSGLDPLETDAAQMMREGDSGGICAAPGVSTVHGDGTEAAGWPFFGQLIAHDLTADRSPVTGGVAPEALHNARRPRLNLEMIYSDGPIGSPFLFDLADPAKFLLSPDGNDVPRNHQGVALIGDPRNDSHLFVLALHLALLRAHNRVVDLLRDRGVSDSAVFDEARLTLSWHYQWVVRHDFLPRLVGAALVDEIVTEGGRWFTPLPGQAFIPLEFSHAAFRYGHGQIRPTYRLVDGGPAVPLFPDLIGFGPLSADRRLDLAQIFDLPGRPPAQRGKRIDGRLAASLIGLPEQLTGAVDADAHRSLAVRDLLRGPITRLPSGEAVAREMGITPLSADEVAHVRPRGTPLWFYILKEAEHRGNGDRLGPVGARIVAEVLIGLLRADPTSYLSVEPNWQPSLPAAGPVFGLADLLALGDKRA